jgi:hypothetical protein
MARTGGHITRQNCFQENKVSTLQGAFTVITNVGKIEVEKEKKRQ